MSKLVTLAKFSFPLDANIAKANLESIGIPSFIADEHTINMQWLYSDAMGGVRLLVSEQYYEQATSFLSEDFSDALELQYGTSEALCEQCISQDVEPFTKGKRSAFIVFILLGFPLFFYEHGMKCKTCGHFIKT